MAAGHSSVGEVRVKPDRLHAFAMAICRADGSSAEEAKLVADHLVLANLFGHDSHGVGMMPAYIQNTTTGRCVRNHAKISRDNGAVVVVDGGAGYGQVVAKEAMDIGIERAKKHGVCVVGLVSATRTIYGSKSSPHATGAIAGHIYPSSDGGEQAGASSTNQIHA